MQPSVRIEFCAEAEQKARDMLKDSKPAQKPQKSAKDRSKMVDAAQRYGVSNILMFFSCCFR